MGSTAHPVRLCYSLLDHDCQLSCAIRPLDTPQVTRGAAQVNSFYWYRHLYGARYQRGVAPGDHAELLRAGSLILAAPHWQQLQEQAQALIRSLPARRPGDLPRPVPPRVLAFPALPSSICAGRKTRRRRYRAAR